MVGIEPHLWSDNLHALVAFYTDALGFTLAGRNPDSDAYTWSRLTLGDAGLMIADRHDPEEAPTPGCKPLWEEIARRFGQPGAVTYYVPMPSTEAIDALFARVTERGVKPLEPIWDAWWGMRQFSVADPDGNILTFATPTAT